MPERIECQPRVRTHRGGEIDPLSAAVLAGCGRAGRGQR
jgi:hypothetical protein